MSATLDLKDCCIMTDNCFKIIEKIPERNLNV